MELEWRFGFSVPLQVLLEVARSLGVKCHTRGTMLSIEGPRFSSRAESLMFRQWGADVINMTTVPEVVLAKEAGLCYASIAMATDYDCWKEHEEAVSTQREGVMRVFRRWCLACPYLLHFMFLGIKESPFLCERLALAVQSLHDLNRSWCDQKCLRGTTVWRVPAAFATTGIYLISTSCPALHFSPQNKAVGTDVEAFWSLTRAALCSQDTGWTRNKTCCSDALLHDLQFSRFWI